MSAADQVLAVRSRAGLFRLEDRGLLSVRGGDRVRWLDGMVSHDIQALGAERTGCYASLLTRTGRMVADLHVLWAEEALRLELERSAAAEVVAHLDRFIIADDVQLANCSEEIGRLAVEGPAAPDILEAIAPGLALPQDACGEVELAGAPVTLAAFGFSGEAAFQLLVPAAAREDVAAALLATGAPHGLVEAGAEALEILRIEAGIPRVGSELDDSVLPDEAGLDRTISTTKGCYTGQEVVARLRSQGVPSHRLMGLRSPGGDPIPVGEPIQAESSRVGEITSACSSPRFGSIALGFLRRGHAEPGRRLSVSGVPVEVCALPFFPGSTDLG